VVTISREAFYHLPVLTEQTFLKNALCRTLTLTARTYPFSLKPIPPSNGSRRSLRLRPTAV